MSGPRHPRHFDDATLIAKFWRDTEEVKDECPQDWLLELRRAAQEDGRLHAGAARLGAEGDGRGRRVLRQEGHRGHQVRHQHWRVCFFVFFIGAFKNCPTSHLLFTVQTNSPHLPFASRNMVLTINCLIFWHKWGTPLQGQAARCYVQSTFPDTADTDVAGKCTLEKIYIWKSENWTKLK